MRKCVLCKLNITKENGPAFCVPAEEPRRQRWNTACKKIFKPNDRVCFRHFHDSDFSTPPGSSLHARLKVGAVPHVSLAPADSIDLTCPKANSFHVQMIVDGNELSRTSCSMQTDPDELTAGNDVLVLRRRIKKLETELAKTKKELDYAKNVNTHVSKIFTEGQIKKMQQPEKNIFWDNKDFSNAICLHAAGPKAYSHLYKQGFPIPHVSTLQRWVRKVNISEGVLDVVIDCMRYNTSLSANEKICVLSFGEMKIAEVNEQDPLSDSVRGPCNYAQIVIAQGLSSSWKLPVYYAFDCKMTKAILAELIQVLRDASFPVVAVVSDMETANQLLWKELHISREKPWFESPADNSERVFGFADVLHSMKLLRNHFLDTGIIWNDTLLSPQTLKQVRHYCLGSDESISYNLTEEHFSTCGAVHQEVKLAVQLFSKTTASAIRRCHNNGRKLYKPIETVSFIQLVNDWFDVFNSKMTAHNCLGKKPFGLDIEYQKNIITKMDNFIQNNIIPNEKTQVAFQSGILITNAAVKLLYEYVKEKYEINYILTNRLNQDILEQFFAAIRRKAGLNDPPSPSTFKSRLRKYILRSPIFQGNLAS